MTRTLTFLLAIGMIATPSICQQPNLPSASMTWNAQSGPPYPITGVQLATGFMSTLSITSGVPNAPIILATATSLAPVGFPILPNSLLDLNLATTTVIWDPSLNPAINTGPSANLTLSATLPNLPPNITVPYQAALYDPSVPEGVRLTAATQVVTTLGLVTLTHAPGDDGSVTVNLAPYNFTLPYYGTQRSSYIVNSNGFISFVQGSTDFTSDPAELTTQMPRICLLWCDLSPNQGGTITSTIDFVTYGLPTVRVDFTNVPDFGTGGPSHTMAWWHWSNPIGDVYIIQSPYQLPSQFTMMVGIAAGASTYGGMSGPQVNLSMIQDNGGQSFGPGIPIYEWFGFAGQAYYSGPTNTFDLINRTLTFQSQLSGTSSVPGSGGYYLF